MFEFILYTLAGVGALALFAIGAIWWLTREHDDGRD